MHLIEKIILISQNFVVLFWYTLYAQGFLDPRRSGSGSREDLPGGHQEAATGLPASGRGFILRLWLPGAVPDGSARPWPPGGFWDPRCGQISGAWIQGTGSRPFRLPDPGKISLEAPGGRYRASGLRTWFYTPAMASRGGARPDPRGRGRLGDPGIPGAVRSPVHGSRVRDPGRSGSGSREDLPGGTRRPLQGFRPPDVVLYSRPGFQGRCPAGSARPWPPG